MNKEIWPDISSEISLRCLQQNLIKNSGNYISSYQISTMIIYHSGKNVKVAKGWSKPIIFLKMRSINYTHNV